MKLLTQELQKRFQKVGTQEHLSDPLIIAKFFNPMGQATWYATEYLPDNNMCFGYVTGLVPDCPHCDEWGHFSIDELEAIQLPLGLGIERDSYFNETLFSQLKIRK